MFNEKIDTLYSIISVTLTALFLQKSLIAMVVITGVLLALIAGGVLPAKHSLAITSSSALVAILIINTTSIATLEGSFILGGIVMFGVLIIYSYIGKKSPLEQK